MEKQEIYKDFLVGDFLCDEYFQDWTIRPNPEMNLFWEQWLKQNPEKEADVVAAKNVLSNIDFKVAKPVPERAEQSLQKTLAVIDALEASKHRQRGLLVQANWVWKAVAIAASVLLAIGLGWKFFTGSKEAPLTAKQTEKKTDSLVFVVRHEVNTSGKERRIQLPDGSLIVLADKSEITYREPFINSRNMTLIGKAYFKVTHDQTKPFTVTSGEITTTDLGTEFTVTAIENTNQIFVRLYEGKVVVKAVDKTDKKMKNDVYLLPGQEFVYSDKAFVREFKTKTKNTAPEQIMNEERLLDTPLITAENGDWFMFNNQPLAQVLEQLAALYNVRIVYNKKDVQSIYFTSKYNKSVPLETILKQISTPNQLTVTKKDSAYLISK